MLNRLRDWLLAGVRVELARLEWQMIERNQKLENELWEARMRLMEQKPAPVVPASAPQSAQPPVVLAQDLLARIGVLKMDREDN
jgi:hypothetical protein